MDRGPTDPVQVPCPYCWQPVDVEPGDPDGVIVDCGTCCRPVRIRRQDGGIAAERGHD